MPERQTLERQTLEPRTDRQAPRRTLVYISSNLHFFKFLQIFSRVRLYCCGVGFGAFDETGLG